MTQNTVNTHVLEIRKNEGLTHALKRYVEQNPNSIMSDGEITLSEWNATIDKLKEINEKRKAENKTTIFRRGSDTSDYHKNYIVYDTDRVTLTNDEMNELYQRMGVSFKQNQESSANVGKQNQPEVQNNPPLAAQTNPDAQTQQTNKTNQANQTQNTEQPNKTATSRYSLSWGEIGKQALKSTGNFFKGMFCDEKGFSLKRTAATVGIIGGTAVLAAASAPAALVVGAGLGLYMAYEGGKKLVKGTSEYYKATTHEEAQAAMEKAMDGGVETTMGVAALFGVKKGYSNMKQAKAKAHAEQAPVESAPKANSEPTTKPVAEPVAEAVPEPVVEPIEAPKGEVKIENSKPIETSKSETKPELKPVSKDNFVDSEVHLISKLKPRKVFNGEAPKDLTQNELETILKALEKQKTYEIKGVGRFNYSQDKEVIWLYKYEGALRTGNVAYDLNGKMSQFSLRHFDSNNKCTLVEYFNHKKSLFSYKAITKDGHHLAFDKMGKIDFDYGARSEIY